MAANVSLSEEDCTCSVCHDIFTDPVVLSCGHSFCEVCLQEWWRQTQFQSCPICKKLSPMAQPPVNLALRNLSETLRKERNQRPAPESQETSESKKICSPHDEKLRLYCKDDQQLICLVCRDARQHKKHDCVPLNEAAEDYKTDLKVQLKDLKKRLMMFQKENGMCDIIARHIKVQAHQTEKMIKEEFQKLYQVLRAEEAARIDAVKKEETLKTDAMTIRIENLNAEISSLSDKIKSIEEAIKDNDLSFMLNVKTTMERAKCDLPEPKTPSSALINEAEHVGNLLYKVWMKLMSIIQYTPVTLDPNTGGGRAILSEHLTRSTESQKAQELPYNPERQSAYTVLGSKAFSSGKHSWDVEVGGKWALGVTTESQTWGIYICLCSGILRQFKPRDNDVTPVSEDEIPNKVRVQLDYDQGILSFFDLDRKTPLHTIKDTFPGPVFPYFSSDTKILPVKLSVGTQPPT